MFFYIGTRFDASKETFGMAIGNIVAGLLGGTPCTGVLVRTAVNVSSGATYKYSQFINACVVLLMVLVLMPYFAYIPMHCIAAILVTSSCRLVPLKPLAAYWRLDMGNFFILLFTCAACVLIDGAMGLLMGAMICLLRNAVQSREGTVITGEHGVAMTITVEGCFTYITSYDIESRILDRIREAKPECVVIVLSDVTAIDLDGLESLAQVFKQRSTIPMACVLPKSKEADGAAASVGNVHESFQKSKLYDDLSGAGLTFSNTDDAAGCVTGPGSNNLD